MIKEYRKRKNLTQEELAEKVELSWRQMQRIEKNEYNTKISTLIKIINILEIPDKKVLKFIKGNK